MQMIKAQSAGPDVAGLLKETPSLRPSRVLLSEVRDGAAEEIQPCVSWTLENEEAIYVNTVGLANDGGFHHSNWFVVPDDTYEGPDGYWDCNERGFTELASAALGTRS